MSSIEYTAKDVSLDEKLPFLLVYVCKVKCQMSDTKLFLINRNLEKNAPKKSGKPCLSLFVFRLFRLVYRCIQKMSVKLFSFYYKLFIFISNLPQNIKLKCL